VTEQLLERQRGVATGGGDQHIAARGLDSGVPTIVIAPGGSGSMNLAELWRYRELVYFLAARDVKVKYKQTALGAAWVLIQPVLAMAIFTLFLGSLAGLPSDGIPYPLFAYLGLLPWTYFSNATTNASTSLVTNTALVARVYFPRLAIPIAAVLSGLLDFAIGFGLLLVLLIVFQVGLRPSLLLVPLLMALTMANALAVSLWLSALDVRYRDVRAAIPFAIQVWMFATPVVYPASLVPAAYRPLYGLNPMASVVDTFRWAVVGRGEPSAAMLAISAAVVLITLLTGLLYFRRVERSFADVI